jgi:Holliday junction resolvase
MRKAAKIDDNQKAIVNVLRQLGASVQSLAATGKGCPDLLVGYHGINYLMEVKDGDKVPSARELTIDQKHWHSIWRGSVHIVKSVDEALKILQDKK